VHVPGPRVHQLHPHPRTLRVRPGQRDHVGDRIGDAGAGPGTPPAHLTARNLDGDELVVLPQAADDDV
jgi:hypothetical protein